MVTQTWPVVGLMEIARAFTGNGGKSLPSAVKRRIPDPRKTDPGHARLRLTGDAKDVFLAEIPSLDRGSRRRQDARAGWHLRATSGCASLDNPDTAVGRVRRDRVHAQPSRGFRKMTFPSRLSFVIP